jgi:predicted phosphodiesterase
VKIALISDIHANLVALDAVLTDLEGVGVDSILCLGDVAGSGPQPQQVVQRLRERGIPSVRGNVDDMLIEPWREPHPDEAARIAEEIDVWCHHQLSEEDVAYLRSFPPTMEVSVAPGVSMLCFHGTPRSNREIIRATTPDDDLGERLGPTRTLMAGGHTHEAMVRRFRDALVINPGSVGLPFEVWPEERNPAWAEYALVDSTGGVSIELRRIPVDANRVRRAALESGMPHADIWAADWR